MTWSIEPAQQRDLPQMATLLGLLFGQEADFQPDLAAQHRGLQRILADSTQGQLLVARDDDKVVGMVSLLWSTSTALGDRVAWLEDMIVAPQGRRRGVGKALLQAAIDVCQKQGARRITLLTDADNARAQSLYASFGFQRSAMVPMRLLLAPPASRLPG
jgi:ribosomal protein S18 acetylase RimI-like enzyme